VERELSGIGEVARRSGLTVSALRFYDAAGVLVPAVVDPCSGYRYYTAVQLGSARVVARLRRVGMPVAEIRDVVADPGSAGPVLARHLHRLEQGVADARRELSAAEALLQTLLTPVEDSMPTVPTVVTAPAPALAAALRQVRFAAGRDPEQPAIAGILLEVLDGGISLVATDRYRLAMAPVTGRVQGPDAAALLPVGWVDEILPLLDRAARSAEAAVAEVTVGADAVQLGAGGATATTPRSGTEYPDYRRAVRDHLARPAGVPVDLDRLSADVATAGTEADTVVLALQDGGVTVTRAGAPGGVTVNREFLLEAVTTADGTPVTLALDGPVSPLVVRTGRGSVNLLMPVSPEHPEPASRPTTAA
jgi:DNA-binding transcriptional MerR regulator